MLLFNPLFTMEPAVIKLLLLTQLLLMVYAMPLILLPLTVAVPPTLPAGTTPPPPVPLVIQVFPLLMADELMAIEFLFPTMLLELLFTLPIQG